MSCYNRYSTTFLFFMKGIEKMSTENKVEVSENVEVLSESERKLKEGFDKVGEIAEAAKAEWDAKKAEAGTEFMCNTCGKRFATEAAAKRHFSSAKCTCKKDKGYKEVSKAVVENEDRKVFMSANDPKTKLSIAAEATKELRDVVKTSSTVNGKKITVVDLTRCPTPSLESMLKMADTVEIKKFVSMRFHPANASRKFIAEKELAKR